MYRIKKIKRGLCVFLLGLPPALASNFEYPAGLFVNLTPRFGTVFFGEEFRIRMRFAHAFLKDAQEWIMPASVRLEADGGFCPPLTAAPIDSGTSGQCYFSIIVSANQITNVLEGAVYYRVLGYRNRDRQWDMYFPMPYSVRIVPHPLSMTGPGELPASANRNFYFDVRSIINYYQENSWFGVVTHADVTPAAQDGLRYDPASFAILGKPARSGTYVFQVGAHNGYGAAVPVRVVINAHIDPTDTPVFKRNYTIATGTPGQAYSLDLMALVEPRASFILNNPVRFRIDSNRQDFTKYPHWLEIGGANNNELTGIVPVDEAGNEKEITLVARSNTGGDSLPLTIQIPIASDKAKKPLIEPVELTRPAGTEFEYDMQKHITDPAGDSGLRLVIDKIKPAATWLHLSAMNPTVMEGTVPREATGQIYQITLRVTTHIGGTSDAAKVILKIAADPEKTPRFNSPGPRLPLLSPGQPYFHDFVDSRDVIPEYDEVPYHMELAKGYKTPDWLYLENNTLVTGQVPWGIHGQFKIYVIIHNTPGGDSEVAVLNLQVNE